MAKTDKKAGIVSFGNAGKYRSFSTFREVPLRSVSIDKSCLWSDRKRTNHEVTLRYAWRMFEEGGNFPNFRIAAGIEDVEYNRRLASDSDVYKWLEAIGYELENRDDPELRRMAEQCIDWIEAAQCDDGYLMTFYQVAEPDKKWTDLANGHELYCAGHLFQAAVAYDSATDGRRLTRIALRVVDHIASVFGPSKRKGTGGHPEIELALVELYRFTGKGKCLELAKFFVDQRGLRDYGIRHESRFQNHRPVRDQRTVEGHAVRQLYLSAGVTDLYMETGEAALLDTLEAQWRDMVQHKLYITGAAGQRFDGEAFGEAWELPPDRCYCETCAAAASILWNWRMLLATGESRFSDLIERTLYNGLLAGYGMDGEHFFYVNPLQNRGLEGPEKADQCGGNRRGKWHGTACCPPNVMRMLASLGRYLFTHCKGELQIQQYTPAMVHRKTADGEMAFKMESEFPWNAKVRIVVHRSVDADYSLAMRIPGWCESAEFKLNGEAIAPEIQDGYARICRVWKPGDVVDINSAMTPRWIEPHPRVDAVRNCLALQRGPLVYCFEQCDCDDANLNDATVDPSEPVTERWSNMLGGLMTLEAAGCETPPSKNDWEGQLYRGYQPDRSAKSKRIKLKAIPYFAWANREPGAMRVWIPMS